MHFLRYKFVLVHNIGKKFVKIFCFCVPRTIFSGQKPNEISLAVLKLGVMVLLFYSEGYEVSKLPPSHDYHTAYPLSCDTLGALIVQRMLFLRGCFPYPSNPSCLMNYYCNGTLLMIKIHSNRLWSLIIASDQIIKNHLPTCIINFYLHILNNDRFWSLMISSDQFHRQLRHNLHR